MKRPCKKCDELTKRNKDLAEQNAKLVVEIKERRTRDMDSWTRQMKLAEDLEKANAIIQPLKAVFDRLTGKETV